MIKSIDINKNNLLKFELDDDNIPLLNSFKLCIIIFLLYFLLNIREIFYNQKNLLLIVHLI